MRWILIFLVAFLTSCVNFFPPDPEWKWFGPPASSTTWRKIPADQLEEKCKNPHPDLIACAYYKWDGGFCPIYSYLSREDAMIVRGCDGMTIYDHEMKHCAGWYHEPYTRRCFK